MCRYGRILPTGDSRQHLANLPLYYEYKDAGVNDADTIEGTYLDNYKNVFDLYITDSTCDGADLSAKTADDSRNEFINGEAVFYQNVHGSMQSCLKHSAMTNWL